MSIIPVPKKKGRPPTSTLVPATKSRSEEEIVQDLSNRFAVLSRLTHGAIAGNIRSLVVSGAPGVGKSYTVEKILGNSDAPHTIVTGGISAVHLYMLGYKYKSPGSVIVLDDADAIFLDEEAINVLKAMCDTSFVRKVSWLKNSAALAAQENVVPTDYNFEGSVIFISNLDFSLFVRENQNKFSQHFEALLSRSYYLDLRLHTRDEVACWVKNVASAAKLFEADGISEDVGQKILEFISTYRYSIRVLSIRTIQHLSQLALSEPLTWEETAKVTLCEY